MISHSANAKDIPALRRSAKSARHLPASLRPAIIAPALAGAIRQIYPVGDTLSGDEKAVIREVLQ